jgi:hypothetical protein
MLQEIKLWIKNKPKPYTLLSDSDTIMDFTDWMVNASPKSTFHFADGIKHFVVYRNALQAFEIEDI